MGEDLASQPTLSRFENAFDRSDVYRMSVALADTVIERHRRRLKGKVKRITIDLDPTDDPTHCAQQLTFFNGHYDTWCYLPAAGFLTFNEEAEQYLFDLRAASRQCQRRDRCDRDLLAAVAAAASGLPACTAAGPVVTNLKRSPRHLYEAIYCARGDIENRIKELHHGLEIDRTSCSRFLADQLRGF